MPQVIIHTSRLLLRAIERDDARGVYKYRSDADTNKYQGWIPTSIEEVYAFIEKVPTEINLPDTWYQFVMLTNDDKQLVGDIGVHFIDSLQVEIGCTVDKEYQGRGYASEALKGLMGYLFSELNKHRIIASLDPRNIASIKLVESLGLKKEAHFRKSLFINDEWVDDVIYALLCDEYLLAE